MRRKICACGCNQDYESIIQQLMLTWCFNRDQAESMVQFTFTEEPRNRPVRKATDNTDPGR